MKHRSDPWFITGFAQSGATFTYSRTGNAIMVYFAIKLGAADLSILQEVQAFFGGIGRIYELGSQVVGASPRGSCYYRVSRRDELSIVTAHFDRYRLKGSKASHYRIWREMCREKLRFRKPDKDRLEELGKQLSVISGRR